ncbi:hypothetical protein S2M10_31780 [Sphingomonas sp. S2M10]|uniref:hypothetical protein n=1 Tax=Sphingomonas sp. S2M10 TaxID=2705010 RepID=UPI0014576F45|nr:hypothetical protein [Sphingomonas sp. S2M10]NLS28169.1 hypothetical protein [Sphingomonas sp. S2M10]
MGTTYAEEGNKESLRNATFLQGVTASAIAFALHEAAGWHSIASLVTAGVSVVAFAVSFYVGTLYSHAVQTFMAVGARLRSRQYHPTMHEKLLRRQAEAQRQTGSRYRWQLRFMLVGAVLYFAAVGIHVREGPAPAGTASATK